MRIMVFRTPEERAMGLQHRPYIENDMLFAFPGVDSGDWFHSQNVPEPFDIAFTDADGYVIELWRVVPPEEMVPCPPGTAVALEAKAGNMARWGIVPGRKVNVDAFGPAR
jgi:uncharacterized membrane protein (UPF0127 family)